MNPRTVQPEELRPGHVLIDDAGVPFAVVATAPRASADGLRVGTRAYPDGPFDVRTFSGRHSCRPTHGVKSVESWPTYALASARADRLNRERSDEDRDTWREYSALYRPDTAQRADVSTLDGYLPLVFPDGTAAVIAWMGEHA